jgi:hypothetical protein
MVDALRRAHRFVVADGSVVDLHPTEAPASVNVGAATVGRVDAGDAVARHAHASAALQSVVDEALFDVETVIDFDFRTYGDTAEELRDYVVENWRDARIDDRTVARARAALAGAARGVTPHVLERVRLTVLRPR